MRRTAASTASRRKVERKTGEIAYGFAKYLRDALPNASFIGFTGTPIEKDDVNTPAVFGDYIDIYDISRAVEDGATVPIYYESRLARIELRRGREAEDRRRDRGADRGRGRRPSRSGSSANGPRSRRWSAPRSGWRWSPRTWCSTSRRGSQALDGKAMIVCMSRRICVALYDEIVALRPDWHSDDDDSRRDQDRHDRLGLRSAGLAAAYRQPRRGAICSPSGRRTPTTR